MDMAGKDTNLSSDWQVNGMIPMVESSACSSGPMADSFCPPIWDQPMNGQSLGYSDVNVQNDAATSSGLGLRADMGWTQGGTMLRGGMFLPGMLQQSLPHFPADSGFVERAARFSCFNGGNFGEAMNPFSNLDPLHPYTGLMQGPHEVLGGNTSSLQLQGHGMNMTEVAKEGSLPGMHGTDETLFKNEKKIENFVCSNDEAKQGNGASGNESDEAEFSGRGAQEESPGKGIGSKKRKRGGQNSQPDENNEATQTSTETAADIKQKGDPNPTSVNKPGNKNGKQGSQCSDPPKEDYIHIRARRGQATNSHSLAERVRREKISERMKYLQDLVPGCSKVTGKAVMLDEIINYVQSLQRQVEFLSMKLATVNPRLDFNIEGFLAKDILQPGAGMPSSLAFPPDMTMPFLPLHPSHEGLVRASHPGNSSETLRRPTNLQSTAICRRFKEPASQVQRVWEDELHNVVHMGFNSSPPLTSQDLSGSLPPGHMKAEP